MYNNIILKPSWLGVMDWSKGYYNNTSHNTLNINKIVTIKDKDKSEIDSDNNIDIDNYYDNYNVDKDKDNVGGNNKSINNINLNNFPYYNENAEYIKTNAVFIKPQIKNFYAKEFELLNSLKLSNKPLIKDVLLYDDYDDDDDFSMYNLQRKKQKKKKFIISKIFDDLKDIKNNKLNLNSNNDNTNEINANQNNLNHNKKSEIYSESDISSDDDTYFENPNNKKNKQKKSNNK